MNLESCLLFHTDLNMPVNKVSSSGFTLIELVMVLGLGVLIIMSVTSLFITSLASSAKGNVSKLLKSEGEQAMNTMAFLLRNAKDIENCEGTTNSNAIQLTSRDNGITILSIDSEERIASNSARLTSDAVSVGNTLRFTCEEGFEGSGKYISISFTLTKESQSGTTTISEEFSSGVQVRNSIGTM